MPNLKPRTQDSPDQPPSLPQLPNFPTPEFFRQDPATKTARKETKPSGRWFRFVVDVQNSGRNGRFS